MVHLLQVEIIEDAATGEFIKFADADDYLNLTIFEKMLGIANENKVKLVRGNYANVIGPLKIMDSSNWGKLRGNQIVDIRDNKDYIVTEFPGVGNKLIHRDIIGDLRFPEGKKWEDLAIMPVILASSQIIYHMDEPVYNYRAHINSVSIADFFKKIPNIFDIITCAELVEKNMTECGFDEEYKKQIEGLYILHTLFRVENIMGWAGFSKENKISVINSLVNAVELKYPDWQSSEYIQRYRKINAVFNHNFGRLDNYLNPTLRQETDVAVISENITNYFKAKK